MKWIRWQGLVVFIVIVVLLVLFSWLFAGSLVKSAIESFGSDAADAKVSVERVNLTLDPLGFTLVDLQVADEDQPMKNVVQLGSINAEVNGLRLLMGQVLVEHAEVIDMQFGTERATSGALVKSTDHKGKGSSSITGEAKDVLKGLESELPSVEEILSREELLTKTRKVELDVAYSDAKKRLSEVKSSLPDSAKLDDYKNRIKAVTSGKITSIEDFNERQAELKRVKAELKQDKEAISLAKAAIKESTRLVKEKINALKAAPKEDFERLRSKYDISAGGASNFAALLFGDQAGEWSKQAFYWYEKIKPYIESDEEKQAEDEEPQRLAGRFIHFKTDDPIPDFLLRKAAIGVVLPMGRVDAALIDLTQQQAITNRPTRLTVIGDKLEGMNKLDITGTFDHINPNKGRDVVAYAFNGVNVNNVKLIKSKKMPITLEKAVAEISGELVYAKGQLTATMNGLFNESVFSGSSDGAFGKALGAALQGIKNFSLEGKAKGSLRDLDVDLRSDLDKQIKSALKGQLDARKNELELKLKNRLTEEAQQYLAKYTDDIDGLGNSADVDAKQNEVENMLSAKVDDYKAQLEQERKAKEDQARQELEAKQADAKRKVDEEQAEAKRVLEEKKAEEKRELQDKLKAKFKF